MIGDYLVTGCP